MRHTFGRAIDICFARKCQLSIASSGELFLHVARIKISVVQGISIYKSAVHWEQCMFHALGMMFVGASEPSRCLFPLVPHAASSDLPGEKTYSQDEAIMYWNNLEDKPGAEEEPTAKRVRGRPNVSKYINDVIMEVTERVSKASAPLPPAITAGLSSHSLRRGSAAYANASPKLAIQWISTRGAWLLDSLTKAFAYVGTTTREDQSVGKVLAGYNDPHLPCATPSIRTLQEVLPALEYAQLLSLKTQLFRTVSGFTDVTLNVDTLVLDAVMASLLIHLEEISAAVAKEQASSGYTSHYLYRFHVALDTTNTALGAELTLATCIGWGHQLRAAWETENFAQLGGNCGGDTAVLASAVTQMLSSIAAMQRTLGKLVAMQEKRDAQAEQAQAPSESSAPSVLVTTDNSSSSVEAHTLAGCFYNWYVLQLWHTATNKKQQFVRADLKACINIMLIASGTHISIPAQPLDRDGVSYRLWKQALWTLADELDKKTNQALGLLDNKGRCKTAGSLRKRWRKLRVENRAAFDALCSAYILRKGNEGIVDHCTPESHLWQAKCFK